jgi:sterol 14-demethylase
LHSLQLGDVFTLKMFGQRITFMIGADAHTPFFRASDEEADQAEVYKFMTPVFGKGIVSRHRVCWYYHV